MDARLSLLLPNPQRLETTGAWTTLPREAALRGDRRHAIVESVLERALGEVSLSVRSDARGPGAFVVSLQLDPSLPRGDEAYRLQVDPGGISLIGASEAGLFRGACTLAQLLRLFAGAPAERRLPGLRIEDWPDFTARGVMLDVSRDRVPTMETMFSLIDLLASWKINQLQLYMEHTFAYAGHDVVWRGASPFTPAEIVDLDRYCRERFVELVPNQNSFGHMHRWLKHEPYRGLAECPEGIDHPFSAEPEPYSLCPTDPAALALMDDLYDQLLPCFSSGQFNVGLDETLDLGQGRSREACQARGADRVYLEYLQRIHEKVSARGKIMQFWGDIIITCPELIRELPGDAIALEWGYEANHPFQPHTRLFREAGLEFHVCPGTSSWNSIGGRTDNAMENIEAAAICGHGEGASGLLVADWGDNGHLQPLPISYLGFAVAAGLSWKVPRLGAACRLDLPALLSVHAFADRAGVMGRFVHDLGNAHKRTEVLPPNGSLLFRLLTRPGPIPSSGRLSNVAEADFDDTLGTIEQLREALPGARCDGEAGALLTAEFEWAADMLAFACRIGTARLAAGLQRPLQAVASDRKAPLARELRGLIARHRELWRQRSRPGGLDDSVSRLERTLACLVPT